MIPAVLICFTGFWALTPTTKQQVPLDFGCCSKWLFEMRGVRYRVLAPFSCDHLASKLIHLPTYCLTYHISSYYISWIMSTYWLTAGVCFISTKSIDPDSGFIMPLQSQKVFDPRTKKLGLESDIFIILYIWMYLNHSESIPCMFGRERMCENTSKCGIESWLRHVQRCHEW